MVKTQQLSKEVAFSHAHADLRSIGKRLAEYMGKEKIGLNELGRLSGTSGAQIHNIIKGKKYGVDKILNIFRAIPALDRNWLLFGEQGVNPDFESRAIDTLKIIDEYCEENMKNNFVHKQVKKALHVA